MADVLFVGVGQKDDACRNGFPCDFPSPLIVERKESGGAWYWAASALETDGLQKLYGYDVKYHYANTGGTLYYAGAGTHKGGVSW